MPGVGDCDQEFAGLVRIDYYTAVDDGSVNVAAAVSLEGQTPCGTGRWTQRLVVHVAPDGSFSGQTTAINAAAATIPLRTQYSFSGAANTFAYAGSYSCA